MDEIQSTGSEVTASETTQAPASEPQPETKPEAQPQAKSEAKPAARADRPPQQARERKPDNRGGNPPKREGQKEGQKEGQGQRPPREGGGNREAKPGGENRGPRGEGPRGEGRGPRPEGRGPGGDRGDRGGDRGGRPGGFRPDLPLEIDLDKLIGDSLYLDNQAHAVVARMRDMDSGTKSQLRRLYNAVRRAVRAPEAERQHHFVMLRARLAYTIARHSLRSLDALEKLLLQVTRKNDGKGYERFKDLFEAIVAYNE